MKYNQEIHRIQVYLFKPVEIYRPMRISPSIDECLSFLAERDYRVQVGHSALRGFISVGIEDRTLDETVIEHLKSRGWEIYQRL